MRSFPPTVIGGTWCLGDYQGVARVSAGCASNLAEVDLPVFHKEKATPAPRITKVMPSDHSGGNLSQPIASAMKIFDPMKTSNTDSAYLR